MKLVTKTILIVGGFALSAVAVAVWLVYVTVDGDFAIVAQLGMSLSIVIFILSLVTWYLVSINLVFPITKLTEIAKKMADGDHGLRSEYQSDDEIGILAQQFNQMVDKLENYYSNLENDVEVRTKELNDVRQNLEQIVNERTKELKGKIAELESFNSLVVDRENKMVELKGENIRLRKQLDANI